MDLKQAYLDMLAYGEATHPPACYDYVYRLIYRLSGLQKPGSAAHHSPVGDVCRAFEAQVHADFGDLAGSVLTEWSLASFAHLGGIVFQLARHGLLALGEGESLEEYAAAGPFHFH
jgi:uncharacterized repeat protein (TIGR04138 family)